MTKRTVWTARGDKAWPDIGVDGAEYVADAIEAVIWGDSQGGYTVEVRGEFITEEPPADDPFADVYQLRFASLDAAKSAATKRAKLAHAPVQLK
jgi:hypothetical protein